MSTDDQCKVLPNFRIYGVPPLTAFAASIYATMLLPSDEPGVERYACAQAICLDWRARYGPGNTEDVLPVVRRELFAALDFTRQISFDRLMTLRKEAYAAGLVLKFALLLDRDQYTTSSVGKAVALTVKYIAVERRTIQNRWAQFKEVAHLWAAYNDFSSALAEVGPEWQITAWLSFMKNPMPVLAIAKSYRDWGTRHTPGINKSLSTLDELSTWDIPTDVASLPENEFFSREQLYEGLTEEARGLLQAYRKR